jgi:hypothetical protein
VKKVDLKEEGVSTLAPRKIWFDEAVRRLNADGRGTLLEVSKEMIRFLPSIKTVKPNWFLLT